MITMNMQATETWDTEALVQCKNCKRTFLPAALKIHQKSCKQGKPLILRHKGRMTTEDVFGNPEEESKNHAQTMPVQHQRLLE